MSMDVLLQGVLTADPQSRTSSKGNAYATALLRVGESDAELFSLRGGLGFLDTGLSG